MSDYSQGKIYILKSKNTEDVYIGSTKYTLEERFHTHMLNYYQYKRGYKKYCTSFEIIKHKEPYIELIELYPCESREELRKKEGEYQLKIECVNKLIAGRTIEEYREDNKEILSQKAKEYQSRPEIKERLKKYRAIPEIRERNNQYSKEYRVKNKEELKNKKKIHRSKPEVKKYISEYGKKYNEKNREKILKMKKEKYQLNKDIISEKGKQTFKCICGATIRCDNKRRHEKSHKHIQYIEEMKEKGDFTNINEFIEQLTTN